MTGREYPEEPSGPFPTPPVSFEDREGRAIRLRGYEPGDGAPLELVTMYDRFDWRDRAQGLPPTDEHEIRGWLTHVFRTGHNVVARHEDRAVGHAMLVPDDGSVPGNGDPGPHELAIFVLQEYQHAGIGTRTLRTVLGQGAAKGIDHVWLTVSPENTTARRLYESVGFRTIGTTSMAREMTISLR